MLNPYQQLAIASSGILSIKTINNYLSHFIIYIHLTHKACLMKGFFNKIIINKASQSC